MIHEHRFIPNDYDENGVLEIRCMWYGKMKWIDMFRALAVFGVIEFGYVIGFVITEVSL